MAFRRSSKGKSPIDSKQEELAQQEQAIQQQMEQLKRLIEDAPRVAEEELRRKQEEILHHASERTLRFDAPSSLIDTRYAPDDQAPRRHKSLRSQRKSARVKFLVLVLIFAAALAWVLMAVM